MKATDQTVSGGGAGVPVDVRDQLMKNAEAMRRKIGAPSGDKIRLKKSKKFQLPSGEESSDPLRVVVLDFVSYNAYFDAPYAEGQIATPACFALGSEPTLLVPSDNSPDKQSDTCKTCPLNEFGSKGKGKACGNHRLLAVVEPSQNAEAPVYLIQVPPTSVKYWDAYVGQVLNRFPMGLMSVSTEIYFDPNSEWVSPRFGSPLPNEHVGIHAARVQAATDRLLTEPDVSNYAEPKAAPVRGARAKK
ncbi:MAG TPA: hypothetical protein VMX14_09855 [Anaerolineae bacterium]|nr:hypothetical protein [Anaerolineae bacterium]